MAGYFQQPLAVGIGLFLLVAGAMAAPYYVAFAVAYAPIVASFRMTGPLLAGAAWDGAEMLRGRLLNGTIFYVGNSPWATFGYSQAEMLSVIQIASLTGVYGISFVLAAVNAAGAELVCALVRERRVDRRAWMGLALAITTLGLALAFGTTVLRSADTVAPAAAPVPIALAQANLGPAARWGSEGAARTFGAYVRLTAEALDRGHPRIVFWPEMALTVFLEQDDLYRRALVDALGRHDVEVVMGAPRAGSPEGEPPFTNSVYLLAADGTLVTRYDKQYLLPFMEYFPLRLDMARRRFGRLRELTPGEPTPPLPTRAGKAGILVCNEALLPHVAAQRVAEGADYLVNPANDSGCRTRVRMAAVRHRLAARGRAAAVSRPHLGLGSVRRRRSVRARRRTHWGAHARRAPDVGRPARRTNTLCDVGRRVRRELPRGHCTRPDSRLAACGLTGPYRDE